MWGSLSPSSWGHTFLVLQEFPSPSRKCASRCQTRCRPFAKSSSRFNGKTEIDGYIAGKETSSSNGDFSQGEVR
jgi:hypothetical protein